MCSGTLLEINGAYYLFDCGGGIEARMTDLGMPIQDLRCVFISHMHEDHVGNLSAMAKRFTTYIYTGAILNIYFPEEQGIRAFSAWLDALHFRPERKVDMRLTLEGEVYSDENIRVSAIRTKHLEHGRYPSYAYMIEAGDKRILYTGDLDHDFGDYPTVVFEKDFDAIVCELVHFDVEKNLDTILKSRTKRLIFTHLSLGNIPKIKANIERFRFKVDIAEDTLSYTV